MNICQVCFLILPWPQYGKLRYQINYLKWNNIWDVWILEPVFGFQLIKKKHPQYSCCISCQAAWQTMQMWSVFSQSYSCVWGSQVIKSKVKQNIIIKENIGYKLEAYWYGFVWNFTFLVFFWSKSRKKRKACVKSYNEVSKN